MMKRLILIPLLLIFTANLNAQTNNDSIFLINCDDIIRLEKKKDMPYSDPVNHLVTSTTCDTSYLVLTNSFKQVLINQKFYTNGKINISAGDSNLLILLIQDSCNNKPLETAYCLINGNQIVLTNNGKLPIYYDIKGYGNTLTNYLRSELSKYQKDRDFEEEYIYDFDTTKIYHITNDMIDYFDTTTNYLYLNEAGENALNSKIISLNEYNNSPFFIAPYILRIGSIKKNIYSNNRISSLALSGRYPNDEKILDNFLIIISLSKNYRGIIDNKRLSFDYCINYFYKDLKNSCIKVEYLETYESFSSHNNSYIDTIFNQSKIPNYLINYMNENSTYNIKLKNTKSSDISPKKIQRVLNYCINTDKFCLLSYDIKSCRLNEYRLIFFEKNSKGEIENHHFLLENNSIKNVAVILQIISRNIDITNHDIKTF